MTVLRRNGEFVANIILATSSLRFSFWEAEVFITKFSRVVENLFLDENDLTKVLPVEESDSDLFNGGVKFADLSGGTDGDEFDDPGKRNEKIVEFDIIYK